MAGKRTADERAPTVPYFPFLARRYSSRERNPESYNALSLASSEAGSLAFGAARPSLGLDDGAFGTAAGAFGTGDFRSRPLLGAVCAIPAAEGCLRAVAFGFDGFGCGLNGFGCGFAPSRRYTTDFPPGTSTFAVFAREEERAR